MKYLSVCSGIEAATVAWHSLGWTPVGFSEIEPFPSAVLAHHFPEVPNYGDMTKYKEWNIEPGAIDLMVGGTPCQAFSIAGLRKGLSDPRGNLALVYLGIADHLRPRWVVWENVPGVLSSNRGRDFGSFLGALAELGYGFAYRILDAQFFGVPQRRRRVFVIGYLGDWRPAAAVLFERESLCRDIAPRRESGKIAAAITAHGVGASGADDNQAQAGHIVEYYENHPNDSRVTGPHQTANTVSARYGTGGNNTPIVLGIPGNWIGRNPKNGGNATEPMVDVSPCLTKTDVHAVCIPPIIMAHGQANAEIREDGQATTLTCNHEAPILAFPGRMSGTQRATSENVSPSLMAKNPTAINRGSIVRRLTPTECERLQGFPDNWTRIPWRTWQEANRKGISYESLLNERGMKLREPTTEKCPDAPRYKACGNSMATPPMRWIGERIQAVEDIINKDKL